MSTSMVLVLLAVGALVWVWRRNGGTLGSGRGGGRGDGWGWPGGAGEPSGVTGVARRHFREMPLEEHGSVGEEALRACRDFDHDFQRTFGHAAALAPEAHVRRLFAHRARAQKALGDVRMRLPNDLTLERRFAEAAEEVDRAMMDHIEDARVRCGAPLVHPGPVDDAWFGAWYRAANDSVQ